MRKICNCLFCIFCCSIGLIGLYKSFVKFTGILAFHSVLESPEKSISRLSARLLMRSSFYERIEVQYGIVSVLFHCLDGGEQYRNSFGAIWAVSIRDTRWGTGALSSLASCQHSRKRVNRSKTEIKQKTKKREKQEREREKKGATHDRVYIRTHSSFRFLCKLVGHFPFVSMPGLFCFVFFSLCTTQRIMQQPKVTYSLYNLNHAVSDPVGDSYLIPNSCWELAILIRVAFLWQAVRHSLIGLSQMIQIPKHPIG